MSILEVLKTVNFGQRVAEEEGAQLANYFVETDHWRKLFSDEVDIVYGPKGAGKSALYSILTERVDSLFDRNILLAPGENPRGATAFQALINDPPASEREFIALWKLYLSCLVSNKLDDYEFQGSSAKKLRGHLEASGLLSLERNLKTLLHSVSGYVKRLLRPAAVEAGIKLDPFSQLPSGVTGKIIFAEPSLAEAKQGITSVDHLLELANDALETSKYKLWFLLDRLDVAFSDSPELEQNALRALFHVYLDLFSCTNLRLKIFLRTDIWRRITTSGFREASHITRDLTISWNEDALLNLVMRRVVQNEPILSHYKTTKERVLLSVDSQKEFFYRLFPNQVETGTRKARTFDWMLGRTCDASKMNSPRELIHLLIALCNTQVKRLEFGEPEQEGGQLFASGSFKEALPEVSRVRLEQTLYAEYPDARTYIEKLRGEKTEHSIKSLADLWAKTPEEVIIIARNLNEIGFFELRGERDNPSFWVPLLYRDALDLVQGAAE